MGKNRRNMQKGIFIGLFSCILSACAFSDAADDSFYIMSYTADFSQSLDRWEADFADYPAGKEDSARFELAAGINALPQSLANSKQSSLMVSGYNYNEDLFMFIKRKVEGLLPNTQYTIVFDVQLASNAPAGGGAAYDTPGDRVYLKVGAVNKDPKKVVQGDTYRMNVDKGNQSQGGSEMIVIGNISVGANANSYALITRSNSTSNAPIIATTNANGELWLIVGTDSGYVGTTTLFYTRVDVVFSVKQ
jgi:hypothetical protein